MSIFCAFFSIGVLIQVTVSGFDLNHHEKPAALTPAQAISDWVQIMMGRFIAGWGVGALSAAVPVYQSETAPKEIRGTLVATYQLLITLGILVAYCLSIATRSANTNGANWRIVMALGWLWAIILGVGILFMPESPRWLVAKGRYDEAKRAIARVKGCPIDSDHVEYTFSDAA